MFLNKSMDAEVLRLNARENGRTMFAAVPKLRLIAALLLALALSACGGGSMSQSRINDIKVQSGNWVLNGTSAVNSGRGIHSGAGIVQSGSSVTLAFVPLDPCLPASPPPVVQATVSGNAMNVVATLGSVTLKLNLTGTSTQMAGTYTVRGGCLDGDHGTVTLTYAPPVTGTWTGSISRIDGTPTGMQLTLQMSQASTELYGFYTVTGSATLTNSTCFSNATIGTGSPTPMVSALIPSFVAADVASVFLNSGSTAVNINGSLDGPTYDHTMHATLSSQACPVVSGVAILTRQ